MLISLAQDGRGQMRLLKLIISEITRFGGN